MSTEVTQVWPCVEHGSTILSPDFPWHRAVEIAEDCPDCKVVQE